ncbi:hypothetical protein LIN78_17680 [Leeia sp. TBRC 13508]|uniref:Uncharacterized protein n=1 Tax=Leeia speluncae TaxID=2884804 RepID=A0ABS8DBT5_9NEIS|nr:hypothetical protein [Leeia speluncae]MCB6185381.1 hypothetical protein [Leeia speluncae]
MIFRASQFLRLALLCCLLWLTPALADENDVAVKQALSKWRLVLQDVPGEYGIPYSNAFWRFVRAESELDALAEKDFLASGRTTAKGEVMLSKAESGRIFSAWQQSKDQIWFVEGSQPRRLQISQEGQKVVLDLVREEPAYEKKERLAREAAAKNRATPLPVSTYTQVGFPAKQFVDDFRDWQQRFQQDVVQANAYVRQHPTLYQQADSPEDEAAVTQLYLQSIAPSTKGNYLKQMLLAGKMSSRPATDGTVVIPSGVMFEKLMLEAEAKPVGYGGEFEDDGKYKVSLIYMQFSDMKDWSVQDFNENAAFAAFKVPKLPAYQSLIRDQWPALVFTREASGRLMLYGNSREMATILNYLFSLSIS